MTDEICRRCNGKQQRRRRGGQCAAPKLGYEQNQKPTYYCSYLGHQNEATFVGEISERRPTNTTHHPPTFSVKRCASAQNPCKVGGWVYVGGRGSPSEKTIPRIK